jgi:hypothetical protein
MGRPRKNKGLGDVIANVTTAIGIEPCDGCNRRKDQLNKLFPFGIEDFTEIEREYLGTLFDPNKKEITATDQKTILEIYCRIFRVKMFEVCQNCPGVWKTIINKLKNAYEN